jgi:hypothetical protein
MKRILIAALLGAACLSACGSEENGGEPAAGEPSERREFERARQEFAECMRENGIDFPDPGDGPVKIDGRDGDLRAAEEACAHLRENIEPPEISDEQREEFKEAALEHARCMREQGIDFPDPTFGDDGGAQVRIRPGSGIDPDDPDFREAQEACADKLDAILEARP